MVICMKYDFDTLVDRRKTSSLKWDVGENELPMWVADMDFKAAPEIMEAIFNKAKEGVYGYSVVPDEWYDAYIGWWKCRHNLDVKKEWLVFSTGVIPSISSIVRKLTTPAEKIVIQTPVYNIFFNCILNNGREVVENPLIYNGENYSIDFDDLESKLSDPQTTMMIISNPHNPVGRIWSRDELQKIGKLCKDNNVTVVSDEIHCDLTKPGCEYIPFASVSDICRDNSITCVAPSKAFNLAGMQSSAVIIPNKFLRHRVWRGLNTDEVAEPNFFAIEAAIAAFTKGGEWLDELRDYIYDNIATVGEFLALQIPDIKFVPLEATYLLWLDCSKVTANAKDLSKYIRKETGLYMTPGSVYGKSGNNFIRLNVACPRQTLMDGLSRLKEGVEKYKKQNIM